MPGWGDLIAFFVETGLDQTRPNQTTHLLPTVGDKIIVQYDDAVFFRIKSILFPNVEPFSRVQCGGHSDVGNNGPGYKRVSNVLG